MEVESVKADLIFETVLYADDLAAPEEFYRDALGLEILDRSDLMVVFRCGAGVLLVFDPEKSGAPGRTVPSHGAIGPGHLAFAAREDDLDLWRSRLVENGVEIESEVEWEPGGLSIYFRDPAGNSIELATPKLWGGGWVF
ncbi:MAG: VOC family protein [Chloroflexi bacterium]|nr:VOC family protein [Chloroflexota bacterium]